MRWTAWLVGLLACAENEPEAAPEPALAERVAWGVVQVPERVPVAILPAEVLPETGAVHELGPGVDGRIAAWRVAPGEPVAAGDPLATLQSPELSSLESRATELAATVAQQERLVELRAAAAQRGVASAADLREAQAVLVEARAARDAVRRQLRAHRDTTTREGGSWTWRAPADGVVGAITCSLGSVDPARTCLTLVQPEGVVLEVMVPERHLARLESPVTATFTAADGRSWSFAEQSRAPVVDPRSRARSFRFVVLGAGGPLPGASGRAELSVEAAPGVFEIPARGLTRIEGADVVFVREGDAFPPRSVEVLGRSGDTVVVRGLSAGDEVVSHGVFLLKSLALLEESE